jgi:hypothetical protein
MSFLCLLRTLQCLEAVELKRPVAQAKWLPWRWFRHFGRFEGHGACPKFEQTFALVLEEAFGGWFAVLKNSYLRRCYFTVC